MVKSRTTTQAALSSERKAWQTALYGRPEGQNAVTDEPVVTPVQGSPSQAPDYLWDQSPAQASRQSTRQSSPANPTLDLDSLDPMAATLMREGMEDEDQASIQSLLHKMRQADPSNHLISGQTELDQEARELALGDRNPFSGIGGIQGP